MKIDKITFKEMDGRLQAWIVIRSGDDEYLGTLEAEFNEFIKRLKEFMKRINGQDGDMSMSLGYIDKLAGEKLVGKAPDLSGKG